MIQSKNKIIVSKLTGQSQSIKMAILQQKKESDTDIKSIHPIHISFSNFQGVVGMDPSKDY